ncbi:MAG: hypothetical protein HY332_16170 [Chloroflexi bacterium]|nr:hypothetical protein [Chloroflexota bacterium]
MTWEAIKATPPGTIVAASLFFTLAVAGLAFSLAKLEFGKAARRRRRLRQALARAARARAAQQASLSPERIGVLPENELARLATFREYFDVDEPKGNTVTSVPSGWLGRVRFLWRRGYRGWLLASLIGAFSMATHFGAFWLIADGGWLGAAVVTLGSTVLMVAVCFWILEGLVGTK